jgi:hypothetical protein
MLPYQKKIEVRDISDLSIVTGLLMSELGVMGKFTSPVRIFKRTKEDVIFRAAYKSFHRSGLWLLLRVTLELHFHRTELPTGHGFDLYKLFMVHHLCSVPRSRHEDNLEPEKLFVMHAKVHRRLTNLGHEHEHEWCTLPIRKP